MNPIRRQLNYANVVATLALVFAMSGTALAAKHYLINSTKQINPKVIKKLKGNTGKTGAKGAPGAAGTPGPQGKEGAQGPGGATNVVVRSAEATTKTADEGSATAQCAAGEHATGGGVGFVGEFHAEGVFFSTPSGTPVPNGAGSTPTAWTSSWENESGHTDTIRVYVICASP